MNDPVGEMYCGVGTQRMWRRIGAEEGWEAGLFRAVDLHEQTGNPVQVSRFEEGNMVPTLQISSHDGHLLVHCLRK
jgi:hypothetical protein